MGLGIGLWGIGPRGLGLRTGGRDRAMGYRAKGLGA